MAADGKPTASESDQPTGVEIDPVTGHETTGHVWDGIRELNRPLPRWWLWTFYATIAWALVYVVLYPAVPLLRSATTGVFGYSTRATLETAIEKGRAAQVARLDLVAARSLDEIRADPELARFAIAGGRSAFLVNCVQCHGTGAAGSKGYANLNDDDWLWGGTLADIYQTISYGIRSNHPDTRTSLMPSFGADAILTGPEVSAVAEYVLSLSGKEHDATLAAKGAEVFANNCAACHGETGGGNREFGAPPLNDAIYLYGGDRQTILAQITKPNHGVMPAWTGRLNDVVIKELTVYVHSLGGGLSAQKLIGGSMNAPIQEAAIATPIETIDVEAVNRRSRQKLYQPRIKIFPKQAEGFYRRLKWIIMAVTLAIYWVTPWLRWDRGPFAPDQAVLADMANRRFYFFFIEIWPQEFYYVAGLLIMAGLGLFLVTSVAGRAWCGYTCPQTVWTDLFIWVERRIEGDRNARMKLDAAPWSMEKFAKRGAVHAIWLLIGVATGGAWIFYFADAPTLLRDFATLQAAPIAYITVAVLTATTYVFAGFMREQVCTYMCPWPRIQGAMLDEDSLLVTYNGWRGEPRSRHRKRAQAEGVDVGDCVDCNACVAVCPMGIDIREGNQLECITCALCIDACDAVMEKTRQPRGLISYTTLRGYNTEATKAASFGRETAKAEQKSLIVSHIIRPRTLLYFGLWCAVGLVMLVTLLGRDRLDVNVQPDRNPLYVTLADGSIRNGYTVKVLNMTNEPRQVEVALDGLAEGGMWLAGDDESRGTRAIAIEVEPDRLREIKVFVAQPPADVAPGLTKFAFTVRDLASSERGRAAAEFYAPGG